VGNVLTQTDRLGNATSYAYDALYRRTSETNANGETTAFTYDLAGNRLTLTDPESNTTTWAYDNLNRVTSETNELNAARYFSYDSIGNLIQKIDRDGRYTQYEYDNLYRRTEERWLDPTDDTTVIHTLNWTYDAASQLTEASDSFADYDYSYDALGRATSIAATLAGLTPTVTLAQQFDANSRRTQLAATIGTTADFQNDYTFDALNRLTQITQQDVAGGNTVADKRVDLAYLADGQFDEINRYASLDTSEFVAKSQYGYDGTGRLTSLSHVQGATTFAGYGWTYDAANRITSFTNSQHTSEDAAYSYDDAGQLTDADRSGTANDEAYTFDDNGNRVTANGDSYTTGTNNRLASDGTYNYEYDAEGNRTKRIALVGGNPTGATTEYGYDHRNRLISVVEKTSPTGTVTSEVEYAYDAFDRRIQKVIDADGAGANGPKNTTYIHDGQAIVLSFDGDDNLTHRYLYGDAVDQLFADESATGDVLWGLTDHQNTPRDVVEYDADTDTTTVANHISYDGFGRIKSETAAAVDYLLGFQGMERDEETGTFHADNREYDPQTGSWTQEDKIGFTGGAMKLDEFVGNSPINFTDPSGLARHRDWYNNSGWDWVNPWAYTASWGDRFGSWLYPAWNVNKQIARNRQGTASTLTAVSKDASVGEKRTSCAQYQKLGEEGAAVIEVGAAIDAASVDAAFGAVSPSGAATSGGRTATTTGKPVTMASDTGLVGQEKLLRQYAGNVKAPSGFTDVFIHGAPGGQRFSVLHNGNYVEIGHRELAAYLKSKGIKGDIRLVSCNAGQGNLAQDLSNKLGVKVRAANNVITVHSNGTITGPAGTKWIDFTPTPRK
jgi:RHS repeat-associated protein